VSARYVIRPKADQDLDDQAYYLAIVAAGTLILNILALLSCALTR